MDVYYRNDSMKSVVDSLVRLFLQGLFGLNSMGLFGILTKSREEEKKSLPALGRIYTCCRYALAGASGSPVALAPCRRTSKELF